MGLMENCIKKTIIPNTILDLLIAVYFPVELPTFCLVMCLSHHW